MNTKDIQIGKYYKLDIWDDELILVQCIDKDGYYFVMETPYHDEWLVEDIGETSTVIEVPKERYAIHLIGLLIEEGLVEEVNKILNDNTLDYPLNNMHNTHNKENI